MPAYPTELLSTGRFARIPHLYGTNSDEGTDNAPAGGVINSDQDLYVYPTNSTGFGFPDTVVRHIMELYPKRPRRRYPIEYRCADFSEQGLQCKRIAAIMGDAFYHSPRLTDARVYAKYSPTYIYRFNTLPWHNNNTATEGGKA
jgi:carboxylesterase type B